MFIVQTLNKVGTIIINDDHWPVSFLHNLNPTTRYDSLYMQPLPRNEDYYKFCLTSANCLLTHS